MDLDEVLFSKEEDDSQAREEEQKIATQNLELYKRTISLLKTKMIKSDVLIRQYNDKIKECDLLSEELSTVKTEKQDVLNKNNLMMEKVMRMELASMDYKQSIDKYKRLSEGQKLKLDEIERLITQYDFKIKSLEVEKSTIEDNMKALQENLKASKVKENEKKQTKHKGCQTLRVEKRDFSVNTQFAPSEIEKRDFSTNTHFALPELKKPLMQDKIIMTDEILRTEPFPIFCTKCKKLIDPAPIEQILRIMSSHPPLLSKQISPPNSPGSNDEIIKIPEPFEIDSDTYNEESKSHIFDDEPKDTNMHIVQSSQEIDKPSFLELARRIDKLENLLNKKQTKTKEKNQTNKQCCASKNIKFVVKVPNEKEFYEYRKREKHKLKKVKRLKNKPFKINKKHHYLDNNKWIVEHCTGSANEEAVVHAKKNNLKKKSNIRRKKEINLLFESPECTIPEKNINSVRLSPLPDNLSPSYKNSSPSPKSLSPLESFPDVRKTNKLVIKKKLFVENVNMQKSVVKSSSDVDISISYSSLSSQISVNESINESIVEKDASETFTKNSSSNNNNLHISNIPVIMENNEENRQRLLPNEVEVQDNLLSVEVFEEKIDNNNKFSTEQDNVNNLIEEEEKEDNVIVNKVNDSINENIDDEKISKPTENLVPLLKLQENNLLQLPINTENTEKHDEIIISTCKQIFNLDLPLHLSNEERQIDSDIFTETKNIPSTALEPNIDENKEKENTCTEEALRDTLENVPTTQESTTEPCSIDVNDVKMLEHSFQHVHEIDITKKNTFTEDASFPNKSFTSELIESPKNCDRTNESINDEVPKCISPQSESDLYKSILVEKTDPITKPITCETQNTQEDLLTMLTETPDEESSNNECILSGSPASSEKLKSAENTPLVEKQVITETEIMNEDDSCTLPIESLDVISTTRVTRSSLLKQTQEKDVVMQENRSEDNASVSDLNFQNSHMVPIMPSIQRHAKISTLIVEKFEKIASPIPSVSDHVSRDNSLSPVVSSIESKPIESVNENSNSSNVSSETKYSLLSRIKRGKTGKAGNVIVSEESSEDCSVDSICTRKRKNLDSDRESPLTMKKMLTRISNLRKSCDDPDSLKKMIPLLSEPRELSPMIDDPIIPHKISIPTPDSTSSMMTETSTTVTVDTMPSYIPPKKQRIAHTPKNVDPSISMENKQNAPKMVKKRKSVKKSTSEPGDKISEILEVFDKTCKERQQIFQSLKPPQPHVPPDESLRSLFIQDNSNLPQNTPLQQPSKKLRGRPPKNAKKKLIVNKTSESSIDLDISQPKLIIEESQSDIIPSQVRGRPPKKTPKKSSNANENSETSVNLDLSTPEAIVEESEGKNQPLPRGRPRKVLKKSCKVNENAVNSINLDLQTPKIAKEKGKVNDVFPLLDDVDEGEIDDAGSPLPDTIDGNSTMQDEIECPESKQSGRKKNIVNIVEDDKSPVRELRSRQVAISQETTNVTPKAKLNCTKKIFYQINETNSCLRESTMRSSLNKFLCTRKLSNRLGKTRRYNDILRENEATCHDQLDILIDTEDWTTELNSQVMENLLSSQGLKTIAFSMTEYVAQKCPKNEPLDKCNTPPAPMMPRSEQKLVTLISTISQVHREFSGMVEKGLEFKLFRLGVAQDVQMVERLFRILVVLNKIKKDREKVRMFCCDALYCLGLRAMNIIYVALTCWPEVFPKHDSNNDIIVKTIVHIVMTLQVTKPYPKLNSLRTMLSTYYEYPNCGYMTNVFRVELMKNLEENTPGINTAVLILCKKLGPNWTLDNIIKAGLTHMIVTQTHPSLYEALSLLGNLLRSFPVEDPNKTVGEIIDQLCDVLDGNAGSDDLQEGIVSCLLSISKFKYEQVARSVIKWQFDKELRSATKIKLSSFFKVHDTKWWWQFVQTNFPLPLKD